MAEGHPGWGSVRARVPQKRGAGLPGMSNRESTNEVIMRRLEEGGTTVVTKESGGGGGGGGSASPAVQPKQTPIELGPDRFHKSSRYVIVAKDHHKSDGDPVLPPGYKSPGAAASSVRDGYQKALEIAARDGVRCPLLIMGGGGSWIENVDIHSDGVELYGWGGATIQGNASHNPEVTDIRVEDLTFETVNALPAYWMHRAPGLPLGVQASFKDVIFRGPSVAFYAQRRFYAEGCEYHQTDTVDPALELAPCWIEIEDGPQIDMLTLRGCRMFVRGTKESDGDSAVRYNGYAIRVTARRDSLLSGPGAPYQLTQISYNGSFFPVVDPATTGRGVIRSGVLLDDCYPHGSLLAEGWYVSHRHGAQYGGVEGFSSGVMPAYPYVGHLLASHGPVYAVLRGHDYLAGIDFNGRQFAVVDFSNTQTHAAFIATVVRDTLMTDIAFPGGGAVFFIESGHRNRWPSPTGFATANQLALPFWFYQSESTSASGAWRDTGVAGADSGGSIPADPAILWHPRNA